MMGNRNEIVRWLKYFILFFISFCKLGTYYDRNFPISLKWVTLICKKKTFHFRIGVFRNFEAIQTTYFSVNTRNTLYNIITSVAESRRVTKSLAEPTVLNFSPARLELAYKRRR